MKSLYSIVLAEVGGSLGPAIARLSGAYTYLRKPDKRNTLNQLGLALSSEFTKHWTINGSILHNIKPSKEQLGKLSETVGLFYRDDCFGLGLTVQRQYYKSRDLKPATIIVLSLFLKNLGDFGSSFNMEDGPLGNYTNKKKEGLTP